MQLIYGDKNYEAMDKYYSQLNANNLKQLDFLRKQADFWKSQWQKAESNCDTAAVEKFKANYTKALNDLNSLILDSAKVIQEKYINSIDKIFDELDKKISNGKGTDYLSTEWEFRYY